MADYLISLQTDFDFGAPPAVDSLLRGWCEFDPPKLRPEFFGHGQPVNRSIDAEGCDEVVAAWTNFERSVMLRRARSPRFSADFQWRPNRGLDRRPFPWGCTVRLARSAGDELAVLLFKFLIRHLRPAFGLITETEDYKRRHFVSIDDRIGTIQKYVGNELGQTIPGVYWCTYFGPQLVEKFSLSKALGEFGPESLEGGMLVHAFSSSKEIGTPEAASREKEIKSRIGEKAFFDLGLFDPSTLKFDDSTTAMINEAVMKKRQS